MRGLVPQKTGTVLEPQVRTVGEIVVFILLQSGCNQRRKINLFDTLRSPSLCPDHVKPMATDIKYTRVAPTKIRSTERRSL